VCRTSAAGVSTSPLLAQYGAAKAYVAMFSRALNGELARFNVHVQCQVPQRHHHRHRRLLQLIVDVYVCMYEQVPMFVTTKLAKLKHTSLFVASPAAYARAAVGAAPLHCWTTVCLCVYIMSFCLSVCVYHVCVSVCLCVRVCAVLYVAPNPNL
jgi:NAD(P)-dependent dehydrogenase (short-subunit alcohol dehydrogenase family)